MGNDAKSMEFDYRPVLRYKGKSIMGEGRARLLREIDKAGSLSTAAKNMGMSYRHAWGTVQHMEEILGEKIVASERGGSERGQSALTEAGKKLLMAFNSRNDLLMKAHDSLFKKPSLTVDGIAVVEGKIVLVRRKQEPFKDRYALPGGFVEYGEKLENAVIREFREETGLESRVERLLGIYSDPARDPRGHTVSAVYVLEVTGGALVDSEETYAEMIPIKKIPRLAFDHDKIMADFLRK